MARSSLSFTGEVLHFSAVRFRVTGAGNLKIQLDSLDSQQTQPLTDLVMMTATSREPTQLANFSSQRAKITVSTTAINEYFNISKVIVFVRPIYSGYPQ